LISERIRGWLSSPGTLKTKAQSGRVEEPRRTEISPLMPGGSTPQPTPAYRTEIVLSDLEPAQHPSRGLDQLFQALPAGETLSVLDLGEINQSNVGYITGLGHRHTSEDLLAALDEAFGPGGGAEPDAERAHKFLNEALDFPDGHFDAVFVWDVLQLVPPTLVPAIMDRLLAITRPGGSLLAVFHGGPRRATIPLHSFRIIDGRTLRVIQKDQRPPAQLFNNRSLEELFSGWRATKFFLTRDHLREVVCRR
jgi:SAM-dependent methyltransferase